MDIRVTPEVIAPINPRLFGQFMEKASWGEPGPEAFVDPQTGRLPEPIVEKLEAMRIPVIRFPGGTDVDFIDWRDAIDNVPGRDGGRPVTKTRGNTLGNRFGYDEYFALRDRLGCETIIVCNLRDALLAHDDPEQAIMDAAGLVAYCNAPVGAALPEGMPDWAAVRARNGSFRPYGAEYIQIGNEIVFMREKVKEVTGLSDTAALAAWYVKVLRRYIDVIRAIDPQVKIIIDAHFGGDLSPQILADEKIRASVSGVTIHRYAPGPAKVVRKFTGDERPQDVDPAELSAEDWWYSFATMPAQISDDGSSVAITGANYDLAVELGYRVYCTEWNWNGWSFKHVDETFCEERLPMAQALGVAAYLHGMMRQGRHVDLATQSMLLGHRWGITAVRADPEGKTPPYYVPQGLATTFYNLHHGDRLLAVEHDRLPTRRQPFIVGKWTKWPKTLPQPAFLDVVASADDARVWIHIIQRHAEESIKVRVDLSKLGIEATQAKQWQLVTRSPDVRRQTGNPQPCEIVSDAATIRDGILRLDLPPRTAHIIEVRRPGP